MILESCNDIGTLLALAFSCQSYYHVYRLQRSKLFAQVTMGMISQDGSSVAQAIAASRAALRGVTARNVMDFTKNYLFLYFSDIERPPTYAALSLDVCRSLWYLHEAAESIIDHFYKNMDPVMKEGRQLRRRNPSKSERRRLRRAVHRWQMVSTVCSVLQSRSWDFCDLEQWCGPCQADHNYFACNRHLTEQIIWKIPHWELYELTSLLEYATRWYQSCRSTNAAVAGSMTLAGPLYFLEVLRYNPSANQQLPLINMGGHHRISCRSFVDNIRIRANVMLFMDHNRNGLWSQEALRNSCRFSGDDDADSPSWVWHCLHDNRRDYRCPQGDPCLFLNWFQTLLVDKGIIFWDKDVFENHPFISVDGLKPCEELRKALSLGPSQERYLRLYMNRGFRH